MNEFTCSGLPASWVNGWLAATGATVLSQELRLRWTTSGTPCAVLCAPDGDPVSLLANSWPSREQLESMPIKRTWPDVEAMPRNVPVDAFAQRVAAVRGESLAWTLSSTVTDLHVDEKGNVAHAPFDPPVPRGYVMHDRQGTDASLGRNVRPSTIQRGWVRKNERRARPRFVWPAWSNPLDSAAIDALLDVWKANKRDRWPSVGIHAAWQSVSFEAKSTSDTTRGYGSERL